VKCGHCIKILKFLCFKITFTLIHFEFGVLAIEPTTPTMADNIIEIDDSDDVIEILDDSEDEAEDDAALSLLAFKKAKVDSNVRLEKNGTFIISFRTVFTEAFSSHGHRHHHRLLWDSCQRN